TVLDLKYLLKRGALLAAANWPTIVVQFIAETTLQGLLAVPLIGASILVAVMLGSDVGELLRGGVREMFTTIAGTLLAEPVALLAFISAFMFVMLGGSGLMCLVKGGIFEVLCAANKVAGPIEREPLTVTRVQRACRFSLDRFTFGCRRLFRQYLALG